MLGKQKITLCFASYPSRVGNWGVPQFALPIARRSWQTVCQNIPWPSLKACSCDHGACGCCGTMMVLGEASSGFSRSIGHWNGFRNEVGWFVRWRKIAQIHLFIIREIGASELISVCLMLRYDPLSDRRNCRHGWNPCIGMIRGWKWRRRRRACSWLCREPGARQPCLAEKDWSWAEIGQRLQKDPQHRSCCLDGNVESVM